MCFGFQVKQLLSNYDNSLFKTNFIENTTPLFRDVNFLSRALTFSPLFSCFFFPCCSSHLYISRLYNTTQSAPSPKTLPHPVTPNIHPDKHTPQVNQFTHTYHSTPNAPHPAPLANHFKGRCYQSEERPTEANPSRDPDCSNLTSQTDPLQNTTNSLLAHVKIFCILGDGHQLLVNRDLIPIFEAQRRCNR